MTFNNLRDQKLRNVHKSINQAANRNIFRHHKSQQKLSRFPFGSIFFCVFIFLSLLKRKSFEKFVFSTLLSLVLRLSIVHRVATDVKLFSKMETRSRTTKLIVKNVEMLESSKFDKFDKVSQWLDKLDTFDFHQQQKNPHIGATSNQQNTTSRMSQDKNDDFFDSDSSVNTGMTPKNQNFSPW